MVPSGHRGLNKELLAKDREREENIAKMPTQFDVLTKHVMGEILKVGILWELLVM